MNELVVYLAGGRVGRLILKPNGNMQFRYDPDYDGPPVSQALPVQANAHPHEACLAVFGGLLPEGAAREAIARNLGLSSQNDYGLLEAVGGDCAGAIMLLPPEVAVNWTPVTVGVDDAELDRLIQNLPHRPLASDPDRGIRLSLAGAQDKLPIIMGEHGMAEPLTAGAPTTHIIKPEPERFPGLVDNEAFCMELAAQIGMPVATVSKGETLSGRAYLLVERFDRERDGESVRRTHQEDLCQALGHPSNRKYQADGGPSVKDCVELIRRVSAIPAFDIQTFWAALVFNWLAGNCDAHAKNFSLLYGAGGPRLAPLYDLVSTTVYSDLTRAPAMKIGRAGTVDEVDVAAWTKLANDVGIADRTAGAELTAQCRRVLAEAERLHASGHHSGAVVARIVDGIRSRARVAESAA